MRRLILTVMLLAMAIPALTQSSGEKFPIFVVDDTFTPQTNKWLFASDWGNRPAIKVGGSATEIGSGQYYFLIGTCDSCVPSGYYDIWVDNALDSAYAGIYIGMGNMPPLSSISSEYVTDGSLLYNEDMESDYGDAVTQLGTVLGLTLQTKHEAHTASAPVNIDLTDYGTGDYLAKVAGVKITHQARSKDDEWHSPRGLDVCVTSDSVYQSEPTDYAQSGPIGANFRLRSKKRGYGTFTTLQRSSSLLGSFSRQMELAAHGFYVSAESLGAWWDPPSTYQVAGVAGKLYAKRIPEAIGYFVDVYGDSTVPWCHGAHLRVYGQGGSYPSYAYGAYSEVYGVDHIYGFKTAAQGKGATSRTRGLYVEASQDTSAGTGDWIKGVEINANTAAWNTDKPNKRGWGVFAQASGDTAYGLQAAAQSDKDNAGNRAYGIFGSAARGMKNYGVYGEAVKSMSGGENVGVYGKASGAATNRAGLFSGTVGMDTLRIPSDADADETYPPSACIDVEGTNGVGLEVNVESSGGTAHSVTLDNTSNGQYGYYVDGGNSAEYAFYSTGSAGSYLAGDLECAGFKASSGIIGTLTASTLQLGDGGATAVIGLATVSSGTDTVRVTSASATSNSACAIFCFPVDRSPDVAANETPYVARITGGAFTIYCTDNQSADQKFFWVLIKR